MNKQAAALNLEKTKYCNSHGLSHPDNRSCPYDIAVLCEYAMGNQQFRSIVRCRSYECEVPVRSDRPASPLRESKKSTIITLKRYGGGKEG